MKRILFLSILLVIITSSCYKDEATFTVEVKGTQPQYVITYTNNQGVFIENKTVENGFRYYQEYSSNWQLKLKVVGSSIKVNIYKKDNLVKTFDGDGTLDLNEKIDF